ncbi:hypothetical protein ACJ41O_007033 [Fusarium nematophilum]
MMRPTALQTVLFSLLLVQFSTALLSDEGREYCNGKGSICEAYNKLDKACQEETGPEYYKCICEKGWVPLKAACNDCLRAMGQYIGDTEDNDRAVCKDEDYSVAPIPLSIISQQEEYNKTAEVPTVPASVSETYTIDRSYTTRRVDVWTTTLYGAASVSLPEIAAPTAEEDEDNSAGRGVGNSSLAAAVCAIVLAVILT